MKMPSCEGQKRPMINWVASTKENDVFGAGIFSSKKKEPASNLISWNRVLGHCRPFGCGIIV
jgi:hypothetical protein